VIHELQAATRHLPEKLRVSFAHEDTAMAKDKEPVEILTASAEQTAEQITKQTQDYFDWLQKTMSVPWSNTNLNRILLSNATQNVTATFAFMHKLSQPRNFQEAVKNSNRVYGEANEFV
jgi:hypothetical protein